MSDEPELVNLPPGYRMGPEPPDDWPPQSWAPYVALRLFARSLVALDEPTMAEARRLTSLDDVIGRARSALAVRNEDPT